MIQQLTLLDLEPKEREVRRITYNETRPFLLGIHYARRMPCITHAFGLFIEGVLGGGSNVWSTCKQFTMSGVGRGQKPIQCA